MRERPVIGITKPDHEGNFAYGFIWLSVWLAGGKPLKITPQNAKSVTGVQGVIQAIEKPGHNFYLGVQFHPEFLIYRRIFRKLFKKLVGQSVPKKKGAS